MGLLVLVARKREGSGSSGGGQKSHFSFDILVSARRHSELRLQLLVHHVADADSGDDLQEVWRQAPVEAHRALRLHNLPEEARHGNLRTALCRRCKDKTNLQLSGCYF